MNRGAFLDENLCLLLRQPGFRRSAWLWIQQTGHTDWVVFDEIMPDDTSDVRCVEMVNAKGWPIDEIWVDPAGDNTQSVFGLDTFAVLQGIKTRQQDAIRGWEVYDVRIKRRGGGGRGTLRTP